MNREHASKRLKREFRRWSAMLAVPLFLLGTGLFSFLWNVPLNTLAVPRGDTPPAILVRDGASPGSAARTAAPALLPGIRPFVEHYAGTVTNAGRIDFHSHAPAEVEIRMEGLTIGMNADLVVFNFDTRYGFSMQTSKKPDAYDRTVYEWLKNMIAAEAGGPGERNG